LQVYYNKPLSIVWLKAAVVGSLWASFEIIAGSFLHNLRIPFSGTFLTASSVFLVIAFIQFWKDRGLVWRAGLICALMKSLSPSTVIIGPMVGIFSEALVIELFIALLGRNLLAYSVGGALAVISALFHKVATLLVLYGFNLVSVLEALYSFIVRQIGLTGLEPVELITGIVIIYGLLGIMAAAAGYWSGKRYLLHPRPGISMNEPVLSPETRLFSYASKDKYSPAFLAGHFILIIAALYMINSSPYYVFIPFCLTYIIICFRRYNNSMRFFRKISFWIQFVVITLLAALLLEGYTTGDYFSANGLVIGLKMNLRAFIIMVGFSAVSTELKNPLIKSILYNRGMASLYQSLSLSFAALPSIIESFPKASDLLKRRTLVLDYLFFHSQALLALFQGHHRKKPPVIIITGSPGQGKTTFVVNLLKRIEGDGIRPAGFLSLGIQENDIRTGFNLMDLQTGTCTRLCSSSPVEGWVRQGHYYFNEEVFKEASERLLRVIRAGTPLVIIDEVGPLEMNNGGWGQVIERLTRDHTIPLLWIVRSSLLDRALRKWDIGDTYVIDICKDQEEEACRLVRRILEEKN
jgi:nucleoside-triphosphatase THEP1